MAFSMYPPLLVHLLNKEGRNKSAINYRMKNEQSIIENGLQTISNISSFSEPNKWLNNRIPNWWQIYLRNVVVHEAWNTVFTAIKYSVVLDTVNMWNKEHMVYKHLLSVLGKKGMHHFHYSEKTAKKKVNATNKF